MADLKISYPEGSQNIEGVVTLAAPLDRVFAAHVDVGLFRRWWARGNPMDVVQFDCRSGGSWHVVETAPNGTRHAFAGSFHEVAANERIVQTFEYLGLPERGHVILERMDFTATGPRTTEIRTLSTAQSREARDGMIDSGMEGGWRQSVEALAKLVEMQANG